MLRPLGPADTGEACSQRLVFIAINLEITISTAELDIPRSSSSSPPSPLRAHSFGSMEVCKGSMLHVHTSANDACLSLTAVCGTA